MEPIHTNLEKYRPRPSKKSGQPRNEREDLIEQYRAKLNEEQARDHRELYSYARVAKRLHGITDSGLYSLFQECTAPEVRSFGAMLAYKLKNL